MPLSGEHVDESAKVKRPEHTHDRHVPAARHAVRPHGVLARLFELSLALIEHRKALDRRTFVATLTPAREHVALTVHRIPPLHVGVTIAPAGHLDGTGFARDPFAAWRVDAVAAAACGIDPCHAADLDTTLVPPPSWAYAHDIAGAKIQGMLVSSALPVGNLC
jgi:hypothetical protein